MTVADFQKIVESLLKIQPQTVRQLCEACGLHNQERVRIAVIKLDANHKIRQDRRLRWQLV